MPCRSPLLRLHRSLLTFSKGFNRQDVRGGSGMTGLYKGSNFMDALTLKAFEALQKNILPRLMAKLTALESSEAGERRTDEECCFLENNY